jgi:hypothetical protein
MKNKNHHNSDSKKKQDQRKPNISNEEDPKTDHEWREVMGQFNKGLRRGKGGAWK